MVPHVCHHAGKRRSPVGCPPPVADEQVVTAHSERTCSINQAGIYCCWQEAAFVSGSRGDPRPDRVSTPFCLGLAALASLAATNSAHAQALAAGQSVVLDLGPNDTTQDNPITTRTASEITGTTTKHLHERNAVVEADGVEDRCDVFAQGGKVRVSGDGQPVVFDQPPERDGYVGAGPVCHGQLVGHWPGQSAGLQQPDVCVCRVLFPAGWFDGSRSYSSSESLRFPERRVVCHVGGSRRKAGVKPTTGKLLYLARRTAQRSRPHLSALVTDQSAHWTRR